MVVKTIIIAVAIVASSFIIGGAIIAGQALANGPDMRNNLERWSSEKEEESVAPGSQNESRPGVEKEEGNRVNIMGNSGSNSYTPDPIKVGVGDIVTWTNNDSSRHTATSNDGTFDSDILRKGDTFSFTFDKEGQYSYICALHPDMVGTVVVKGM